MFFFVFFFYITSNLIRIGRAPTANAENSTPHIFTTCSFQLSRPTPTLLPPIHPTDAVPLDVESSLSRKYGHGRKCEARQLRRCLRSPLYRSRIFLYIIYYIYILFHFCLLLSIFFFKLSSNLITHRIFQAGLLNLMCFQFIYFFSES